MFVTGAAASAQPPRYAATVLSDLGWPGGYDNFPTGLNNAGVVVGASATPDGRQRAYRWQDGVISELDTPSPTDWSYARDINTRGDIVGTVADYIGGNTRAVVWHNGAFAALPDDGATLSGANQINDAGQIVGWVCSFGVFRGAMWDDGGIHYLDPLPGDVGTITAAINNNGAIGGASIGLDGVTRPVVWVDGAPIELPTLVGFTGQTVRFLNDADDAIGDGHSYPYSATGVHWRDGSGTDLGRLHPGDDSIGPLALNNLGQVIGTSGTPTTIDPFFWQDGVMYDLNSLMAPGEMHFVLNPNAINDLGWIAATAYGPEGQVGVLLRPVPSPACAWVVLLLGVGTGRRRRA